MFSQKVGEDGYIYNTDRNGNIKNTGVKADRQMWFRDNPGMAPELVGKDGGVRPVGYGVPQQQGIPQAPQAPDRGGMEADIALANQLAQAGFDPDKIDAFLSARGQVAEAPGAQPSFTPAAAKPAMTPAQLLAAQRAQEASDRANRADARAQAEFNRKATQPPNAQAQKTQDAIRAKVPQLQNAIRGMSRIENALGKLNGAMVNTGPMDAMVQKFTPAGQELDAAVGAIQNSILALTRVPGIGSQSDLEARIAALQYPSLDKPPEVNRRTLDNLKLFMRDLAEAYKLAVQPGQGVAASAPQSKPAGGPLRFNPATGDFD